MKSCNFWKHGVTVVDTNAIVISNLELAQSKHYIVSELQIAHSFIHSLIANQAVNSLKLVFFYVSELKMYKPRYLSHSTFQNQRTCKHLPDRAGKLELLNGKT
jgi:hypothetical protein